MSKYVFPVKTCTRCGGCGQFSFNLKDGTICYGCSGSGVQPASKRTAEFEVITRKLRDDLTRVQYSELAVGDMVRAYGSKDEYRAVVSIERTEEACGWSKVGDAEPVYSYYYIVTLDGQEPRKISGNTIASRRLLKCEYEFMREPLVELAYAALTKRQREENEAINT